MPASFSSTVRPCAIALSTRELQAEVSWPRKHLAEPRNIGLGLRLFDGFFGGRTPLCAVAVIPAVARAAAGKISAPQVTAKGPRRTASRRADILGLLSAASSASKIAYACRP